MKSAVSIRVEGTLWKRGFRFYSMQKATELGVTGTVSYGDSKNEIHIHAEGEAEALDQFIKWCSIGSPSCRIKKVDQLPAELMSYKSFDIVENE